MPDRIEVGTFLCMTAITGGNAIINNVNNEDIKSITSKLEEAGAKIKQEKSKRCFALSLVLLSLCLL